MAKRRVYKAPVYPIETQIEIARCVVAQNESAVAQCIKDPEIGPDVLKRCREGLAMARANLANLAATKLAGGADR
jgi:hypothetical protein